MKFLLISPKNRTVWNFRGDLIRALQAKGYEVLVTGPDQIDMNLIDALGVRFFEIPIDKTGVNPFADLKYLLALRKLMKAEKPDVTLGYTVKPVVYGSLAAKLAGVKNINSMVTGAGYTFTAKTLKAKVLGLFVRTLYRLGLGASHHVIFQNPDDMQEFTSLKLVKEEKCAVVHGSGVNMEKFCSAEREPNKPLTFLMISRLLKSKGVMEYLEAAKTVKEKHPEVRFHLLGKYETSMQDAIPAELVQEYEKAGIITRFEETNDIVHFYRECDVYVLPSYREGTPRTVLEAMACGKPIITTDTNGCRETVKDKETGFLVPIQDSAALAEAMERYIQTPDLISAHGRASQAFCREIFAAEKVNGEMLAYMKI